MITCGGFPIDRNGLPVGKLVIKNSEMENKQPRDIWTHRENILLTFDLKAEPNETVLTAIKIDGNQMEFKSFSGFTALDIYNLLFGKENE